MRTRGLSGLLLVAACTAGGTGDDAAQSSSETGAAQSSSGLPDDGADNPVTTMPQSTESGSEGPDPDDTSDDIAESSDTGEPVEVADVHYIGRFDGSDPDTARASWPGSMVRTRIDGTELSIELDAPAGIFFQVAVDGTPTAVFETSAGTQTYSVVAGLAPGEHDIEIVRRNEGFFGIASYLGLTPGADTTFVLTPVSTRRIELVGDSLTAGYGIECDNGDQSFSGATENAYLTYGMVAARTVGADPILVAHSGIGVAQNYGGDTNETMPSRYPRTFTTDADTPWDFSSWEPDVVLVNLGTNDFSAPIDMGTFVDAYAGLLADIRGHNPNATLMAVTWAHWGAEHEGWVHAAVAQAGEDDATVLQFVLDGSDGYGCDYHTNVVSNAAFGVQLADALALELGW